ncbi:MAG TPA: TetR/AcrR family transcriptional regulator [Ktedonobacterales bacterium]|jgi:AcrR family transcriptional regulator
MALTRQSVDRRVALLDAARQIFAAKGVEAARVSEIVARAGVAQGTFYLYFTSKASLVLALTDQVYAEIREEVARALAAERHVVGQVSAGVAAAFRAIERNQGIFAIVHPRAGGAEIRQESERLFAPYYDLVAEAIRAGQERGEIPADIAPDLVARLVVDVIDSAAYACYVLGGKGSVEVYRAEVTRFIQQGLDAG